MFGFYLLDVHVTSLRLNKEVYMDTGGAKLSVAVVFVDFPATEVRERERRFVEEEGIYVYKFRAGQSYHFSMGCGKLMNKMKRVKLKIGIFKPDERFPVCYVHTYLSGCACDMGSADVERPVPFVFRGPFELVDPGRSFAGSIDLEITLTNLGKSLVSWYALAPDCFIFKNDSTSQSDEYKCYARGKEASGSLIVDDDPSVVQRNRVKNELLESSSPGNLMATIAGISPTGDRLALGSPPPRLARPPLVDPTQLMRRRRKKGGKKGRKKK
ncbi:uncharacterized protein LOC108624597 [Ceratina calcarata]|uniref:Uncharacterized protein LOC108624597 n=1 Tax=Ceratina calcarata TaxID=156304 RepID=A0AAJ7N648_9HYME|nr:uncharacterized protein LOC108624597 [Ceratina calcarata]